MTVPNSRPVFIGLDNYTRLFSDANFLASVRITLIFVVSAVTLEFLLGLALALLATSNLRAIGLIRTVLLIPLMMTPVEITRATSAPDGVPRRIVNASSDS